MSDDWHLETDPLEALAAGDPGPFEAFVPRGLASLIGFFRRQGVHLQEAEDLAQDVLMRMVQHAARYTPQERFAAFVFRAARNALIDARRRSAVRPAPAVGAVGDEADAPRPEPADGQPEPSERLETADEAARARAALAELPETHRAAFELGVVQGLPYAEVASLLDIPVGTVKSRVFHAVRLLRARLEPVPTPARVASTDRPLPR